MADGLDRASDAREQTNPWRALTSRAVYENAWIAVREDHVVRPDGQRGIYGVVHFKNHATGVLALDAEDHVYLVGQHRYPHDVYSWEIPEGGVPLGEDILAGAQRELAEETGLTATRWERRGTSHLSNSVSDEVATWFVARELQPGPSRPEGTEQLVVRRVPFSEAVAMVRRGEIWDALSMLAILDEALRRATPDP